ncbi:MAG: 2-oxoglutarate dehydrogenase E1 subunit family protein [Flavisolibacter sp.]
MKDFSYITQQHPAYIEGLYQDFVRNPESVDPEFRKFFEGFDFAIAHQTNGHAETQPPGSGPAVAPGQLEKEFGVYRLIQAYREKAHLVALTTPIRER